MKKILFLLIAFMASSVCLAQNGKMTINGTVTDSTLNGKYVYVSDFLTKHKIAIDSCKVENFKFNYITDLSKLIVLQLDSEGYSGHIILEEGPLDVKLDSVCKVSGGVLNKSYSDMLDSLSIISDYYMAKYTEVPDDEKNAIYEALNAEVISHVIKTITMNPGNNLALHLLLTIASEMDLDQLKAGVAKFGEQTDKIVHLQNVIKQRENELNVKSGVMFIDFEGVNPDGSVVKLSDYVGKGKYVVVDFWASWCAPCRALVPGLKYLYEKYKDKGLVLLGINVFDKKDDFKKAFKELEMPWDQICVFDDKTPTIAYGINSIPQLILFAPDGTIIERNLHGAVLEAKLVEIYKEK